MIDYLESMLESESEEEDILELLSSLLCKKQQEETETDSFGIPEKEQEENAEMNRRKHPRRETSNVFFRRGILEQPFSRGNSEAFSSGIEGDMETFSSGIEGDAEADSERLKGELLSISEQVLTSGAWLYGAWRRGENQLQTIRQKEMISVTLPERTTRTSPFSAEHLDRLVERDARRYDSGFSLY